MCLNDIIYVSDGRIRRADITISGGLIEHIADREELDTASFVSGAMPEGSSLLLPGIIDEHVHTREPGLTHKGNLDSETHAAAAGGVTTIMDMPNVVPQTTTLEALDERFCLGRQHAFVNYSFYFGATNSNAHLLTQLDPARVPAVKLFMGSSTGGMLVDHGQSLHDVFSLSPLPIMAHCEDSSIISRNMQRAKELYGDDPDITHHAEIRSREACLTSTRLAIQMATQTGARLHIAHVSTKDEIELIHDSQATSQATITLEACLPHLLFTDADYEHLGTAVKCNPSVKTAADRQALREALADGRITCVATDHAPHLPTEKTGGCARAASGIPMIEFSLVSMLELVDKGVLSLPRMVEVMCHAPAKLFSIRDRGFIREGMQADLVIVRRHPWTLTADNIHSLCAWSPLTGHRFAWQVAQTYCNGRLIYDNGIFAQDNSHAQSLTFQR